MLCQATYKMKPPMSARLMPGHPLAIGLVGCWPMNGRLPDKVFDLSGNGNDGTLVADTNWVPGKFGPALDFDGDGDFVQASQLPYRNTAKSIIAWVKLNALVSPNYYTIFASMSDDGHRYSDADMGVRNAFGAIRFYFQTWDNWAANGDFFVATSDITTGIYYQLACVYDETNVYFYINGVLKGSGAKVPGDFPSSYSGGTSKIGALGDDNRFNGVIDHVLVFHRALTDAEIALLYREPFCMFNWEWLPGWVALAGEIKEVSGTIAATTSVGVTAKRTRNIAGSIAGVGGLAASAKRDRAVSGVIAGQSNLYGSAKIAEENAILLGCNF